MPNRDQCLLCSFENPKLAVTAICIREGNLLVARRNEEPYKDEWDFIGGYVQKDETPEEALKREMFEELNIHAVVTPIGAFSGTATYQDHRFPVLNLGYLVAFEGDIQLNEENSEISWVPINELSTIAFDSNQKILAHVKEKFSFDVGAVRTLVHQLDLSARVDEQSLYKALLNGHLCTIKDADNLVGMGWIFPRQTLLRKQAVIEDMIVDESQRGKGIGEKILRDLIDWAKHNQIEVIELTTNPKRTAANTLYKKCGFVLHETNHYLLDLR